MLAEAWRGVWELEDESLRLKRQEARAKPLDPELVKLIDRIEDAFREEQMAESGEECVLGLKITDWRNPKSREEQMKIFRDLDVKFGDGRNL